MPGHEPLDGDYRPTVSDRGDGPAMVLVHGTPLDLHAWDGLVRSLATGHRVITYDLRGHGSARSCPLPASYETLSDDLLRLLDDRRIDQAHLVGHSFGGQVAQAFAASHPQRLSGLTVVCARSTPYPPFATAADTIERDGIEAVTESALQRWFTPDALARDLPAVRYARSCMTPGAAPALVTAFRLISGFDIGDGLAALPVCGRFIAAERDVVAAPEKMRATADGVPQGEFLLEQDAGHMFPVEDPGRLARLTW